MINKKLATALALAASSSFAFAGDYVTPPSTGESAPPIETSSSKKVTGSLSLDAYSHFISYGADVWDDGGDASDFGFNPSIGLDFDLGGGWSANIGTWWDVNDKGDNPLGGQIQEIDVWAGIGYSTGIYSASLTYQQWYYGENTEEILDLGLSLDVFLSPSITIHHRLDEGASGGDEGTIVVFGLEYGFETGPVSWSVPVNLAYFLTDDFHGPGADDGFGYASIGLNASYPLGFLDSTLGGEWAFNAGLTYYVTDDDVVVGDPRDDFFVTNFGVSLAF